ncbi:hypothetical protein B0A52_07415 [Exophiala mesophila]|uniref:Zn(2)-C6 fungal-type domain-containing protein n=1 Tax=Exophiala mesophila TaxID=212818 RepID=A0A438MXF4_EXOME|nr:hypothetical protein B0A52_07415 [Exophiala mesophila]
MPRSPPTRETLGGNTSSTTRLPSISNFLAVADSRRRHVAEQEIPGKGICYVYQDGSICPKVPGGEIVNPKWGTTKAGKPRKRLGQACNTCREKKIKCDPSTPKCAQCQKFGRECKFESLTRTTPKQASNMPASMTTPSAEHAVEVSSPTRSSTVSVDIHQDQAYPKQAHRSSMPVESLLSPTSVGERNLGDSPESLPPAKRSRLGSPPRPDTLNCGRNLPDNGTSSASLVSPPSTPRFFYHLDPYELDPDLSVYYVNKYFTHIDCFTDCTIPQRQFTHWLKTCQSKSSADIMLIYAMLAFGATFARRGATEAYPALFTGIVHEAIMNNGDSFSLQLLHTRLILALLSFSQGQYNRAFQYSGTAMRIGMGLGYNMEDTVASVTREGDLIFGLDKAAVVECRRRTFWSAFIMECFSGCCSGSVPAVYHSDIHLRLPCDVQAFEAGIVPPTPLQFNGPSSGHGNSPELSNVGLLGYLVDIASMFNEVLSRISRARPNSSVQYISALRSFHQELSMKLGAWDKSLREHVRLLRDNKDKTDPVSGLHILYHYTAMLLNRHVRHEDMDWQSITSHVKGAYFHAKKLLEMVQRLSNVQKKDMAMFRLAASSPFSGFAITAALDTITAAGTLKDIMDGHGDVMPLISSGLEALERLVDQWDSARQQRNMVEKRFRHLLAAVQRASAHQGAYYFSEPMQGAYGLDQDIIYGLSRKRYLQALGGWADESYDDGNFQRLD